MLKIPVVIFLLSVCAQETRSQSNEDIIKAYFGGWEKKDWNQVAAQLAPGFTFTSPAPDDHINTKQFYDKCWVQAGHIRKFEYVRMYGKGNETFALVHVLTDTGAAIRNIEFFTFENGKIKSIEVFFGGSGQGFPTNEK
jgi:hypothetical protein